MTPFVLVILSLLACTSGKEVGLLDDSTSVDATAPLADTDADGTPDAEDCAPDDATRHPGADELCNALDDDCDGAVDEDATDASTWYADEDGDGFGDSDSPAAACSQPAATSMDATDCDDTEAAVNPAGEEICDDRVDNDCDGNADSCRLTGAFEAEDVGSISEYWAQLGGGIGDGCDVTGDGLDDVLVSGATSATKYDERDYRGVVWVFKGGEGLPESFDDAWGRAGPETVEEGFGGTRCIGDADGDGRAEVAVGAGLAEHDGIYRQGAVYILEFADDGTAPLDGALAVVDGTFESQTLAVDAGGGDVTGNGVWDFAAVDTTTTWVFDGSFRGDGDTSDAVASVAHRTGEPKGLDLSGDYNGDGIADLAAGASVSGTVSYADIAFGPLAGASRLDEAEVHFYLDDEPSGYTRLWLITANLGDTDGDGRDDLGMIAQTKDGMAVYVAAGVSAGTHQLRTVASRLTSTGWGYCLDGAGDIDGDGHTDLVVLQDRYLNIVYGPFVDGASLDEDAVLHTSGPDFTDCEGLGDVTGDGIPDVGMVDPGVYISLYYEVTNPARLYLIPGSGM